MTDDGGMTSPHIYNADKGSGAVADFTYGYNCPGQLFCDVAGSFTAGWTHIVNTPSGVLFYKSDDGSEVLTAVAASQIAPPDSVGNAANGPDATRRVQPGLGYPGHLLSRECGDSLSSGLGTAARIGSNLLTSFA